MNATAKIDQAVTWLQRGGPDRAAALCQEVLDSEPANAPALHLLGVLRLQRGDAAGGIDLLRQSLEADPSQPFAYCNLGNALRDIRQPDNALACYRRALQLMPEFAGALFNQGNALVDLNRAEEALASFDRALGIQPDYPDALNNRGNALLALGRPEEAVASYERALSLRPDFALALGNCAQTLRTLDRNEEALCVQDRLLALQPDDVEVRCNRAETRLALRQFERALADYNEVLRLQPQLAEAYGGRGLSLIGLERYEEALEPLETALRLEPNLARALFARGRVFRSLGRYETALADFDRAMTLMPESADILYQRGAVLRELNRPQEAAECFDAMLRLAPDYDYALGNLLQARSESCDWTGYTDQVEQIAQSLRAGKRVCIPGPFQSVARTAEEQLQCARIFVADKYGTPPPPLWRGERYSHERIRVAYVSADFRQHPVSSLLVGVLERHNRERFETIGISLRPEENSPLGQRVKGAFERFIDVSGQSVRQVAGRLRELEVDIAIDLMGFSGQSRAGIFAARAAPVQINYLGNTATTGLPGMDYIIADQIVIPPAYQSYYTEKIIYLPGCYQPGGSRREVAAAIPTRAACGLPESGFVFCCFNKHYKIGPELFGIWMRLLAAVPGSVLWLAQGSSAVVRNLREAAWQRGIAAERLVFAPHLERTQEHLARYRVADLFLDTLPFNAHATANDALWSGLPVLTCPGDTFTSRVAASLLSAVGLPELIAANLADYETFALRLATAPAQLAELRSRLAQNRETQPLFDTERYCRHLEMAYSIAWRNVETGQPPETITVPTL